jgi:hypothetical protein
MTPEERAAAIDEARERIYDLREELDEGHYQHQILEQLQWWQTRLRMLGGN